MIGASRGILTRWDKENFTMCIAIENKNWLFVELGDKESKETLWVGNIYGPIIQA